MDERFKMYSNGITISVLEREVDFYKRAGYVIVVDAPAEPAEPEKPAGKAKGKKTETDAPVGE